MTDQPHDDTSSGSDPPAGEAQTDPLEATFRVSAATRVIHALTLAVLATMTVGMITGGRFGWLIVVFVLLVIVQSMNTTLLWRWRVTTDDDGVTVQHGLRPPRHVRWDRIRSVRGRLPPVIEVDGEDDLTLGTGISRRLLARTATHIGAHAAMRRNRT